MNSEQLLITVFAEDHPGIVKALSDTVLSQQGNWLESSLSRLCGQFAGIVHLSVPAKNKSALLEQLVKLADDGIKVTVQFDDVALDAEQSDSLETLDIIVEANDRPGIVEEIASVLAQADVNVEHMETECVNASMAGYELFRAYLAVALPTGVDADKLEELLEGVSDDLVVSITS